VKVSRQNVFCRFTVFHARISVSTGPDIALIYTLPAPGSRSESQSQSRSLCGSDCESDVSHHFIDEESDVSAEVAWAARNLLDADHDSETESMVAPKPIPRRTPCKRKPAGGHACVDTSMHALSDEEDMP